MRLRGYQRKAVAALRRDLPKHRSVVAVAPTGSGKTVVAAALLAKWPRKRVLWVAHRIELLRQAREQLHAAGIPMRDLGILSGPDKDNEGARIIIASMQMFREGVPVPPADLVVVDEAHRIAAKTYQGILAARPKAMVLGLTATPWRLDGKGLRGSFVAMLQIAGMQELIKAGHIAEPDTYGVPWEKAKEMVEGVRVTGGDFAQGALGRAMSTRKLMGNVVKETNRLAPNAATLVFAASREHGQKLAARFKRAGRPTAYLDGETPDGERAEIVAGLSSGKVQVVVNVDVLTEGFDCPPVKCIVMARPTQSLTRFLQYAGRASRPYKGKRPIILDHGGNCWRFGLPDWEQVWSLEDRKNESKRREGEGPVKECVECERMIPAMCRWCTHADCGAEQPYSKRELAERHAELERLKATEEMRKRYADRVRAFAEQRGLDAEWVSKALTELAA